MSFRLGIDLGFTRNRYQEPEVWPKIVREDLGLKYVSMVADIFNPSWPDSYLDQLIKRTRENIDIYDIKIDACFTSALTRMPHVMHYDAEMRNYYVAWFKSFFALMAKFECKMGGSNFGIMSFADYDNESRKAYIIDEAVKAWQEISFFVHDLGFECLMFEPMSVPREMGNTVDECLYLMGRVNDNSGVPMRLCIDVGHAPHPDERDPYPWLVRAGHLSPMIHLQQTVLHQSNHSPFTTVFNKDGIIKPDKVMKALKEAGATDALLAFEISHKEHFDTDFTIINDLKASVNYWRPYVKE